MTQSQGDRFHIKASSVITHLQQHPVRSGPQADVDVPGMSMFGCVRQSFLTNMKQHQRPPLWKGNFFVSGALNTHLDQRVGTEFGCQPAQPIHQVFLVQFTRSEVKNIRANVANGAVQIVDCLLDSLTGGSRIFGQQQPGMFQRQTYGVYVLNDPIVKVHADALALFQYRQPALLQVEAHIFNSCAHPKADRGEELHF